MGEYRVFLYDNNRTISHPKSESGTGIRTGAGFVFGKFGYFNEMFSVINLVMS